MTVRPSLGNASTIRHVSTDNCPVVRALHHNSVRGLARVTCDLCGGIVTLRGIVSTFYLKQLAQEIVKKVEGVERVVNQVIVVG